MSIIMQYLSELVHAQLEYRKPGNIPEGIRVEELEGIAHKGHMNYLILGALLKTDLPEEVKASFRPYVVKSTLQTLAQMRCLAELEQRLEENKIYHMVLKGSVLKSLYPSPEMREMSDIDVMIYDDTLERSKKVIEEMGFTLFKSVKHHDIYMKAPFLIVELHNALYDKEVDKNQYEYFKSQKKLITKPERTYTLQFCVEDFYVYLIAHMAKHFYETGCGIRNVMDVYYYRKAYETTWDQSVLRKELEQCGLTAFETRIVTLANVWLGNEKADSFSLKLFDYMSECGIYGKGENGVWGQFAKQLHTDDNDFHSYAKQWYYFPPRFYMEDDYPWLKKHPYLLVIAWGVRAIHGLISKEGREKRRMLLNIKKEDACTINNLYKGMQLEFKK